MSGDRNAAGKAVESKVFTPGRINRLELRNRTIRAGCFEGMCYDEKPSHALLEHHREVAAGGVGMTTVSYCAVSRDGLGFGIEMWMRDEIIPMLQKITDAIHAEGAAASIQLGHCGFFASPSVIKKRPIGPSVKFCLFRLSLCRAMDATDMERIRNDFAGAAVMAKSAGFDAIELHSGHGYLLSQFLSPWTNKRKDTFGGSLENRLRFPVSVIEKVRQAVGPDFPIIIKMNLFDGMKSGLTLEDAVKVAQAYEAAGADALVPSCGFTSKTPLQMMRGNVPYLEFVKSEKNPLLALGMLLFGRFMVQQYPYYDMFLFDQAQKIQAAVKIPVVLVGGVVSLDNMDRAMEAGFEFVELGRATVRDPHFVNKLKAGRITKSDCDHCNRCVADMACGNLTCVCLAKDGRQLIA